MERLLSARTATSPLDACRPTTSGGGTQAGAARSACGRRQAATLCAVPAGLRSARGSVEGALDVAVAIELVHNFSLVHDDIQDQSPTRRGGRPSGRCGALRRRSTWATRCTRGRTGDPGERAARGVRAAGSGARPGGGVPGAGGGQHDDLELQAAAIPNLAGYEAMIARKTAALLAPAPSWARCAPARTSRRGAPTTTGRAARAGVPVPRRPARDVGGRAGDRQERGRGRAKWQEELAGRARAAGGERGAGRAARGAVRASRARPGCIPRVLSLFDATGARATAERLVAARTQEAREALARAPGSPEGRALISDLIELLARRDA